MDKLQDRDFRDLFSRIIMIVNPVIDEDTREHERVITTSGKLENLMMDARKKNEGRKGAGRGGMRRLIEAGFPERAIAEANKDINENRPRKRFAHGLGWYVNGRLRRDEE